MSEFFRKIDRFNSRNILKITVYLSYFLEDINNVFNFFGIWVLIYEYAILKIIMRHDNVIIHFLIISIIILTALVIVYADIMLYLANKRSFKSFTFFHDYWFKIRLKSREHYNDIREKNPVPPLSMNLRRKTGIPLGRIGRKVIGIPLKNDGIMAGVVGVPGGGKSASLVIPITKRWKYSALICDPKNEIHRKAKVSKEKINIINPLLNTSDERYLGFSPFDYLDYYDNLIEGMKAIVLSLLPVSDNSDPDKLFWTVSSQAYLLTSLIYYYHQNLNFIDVCNKIYSANSKKLITQIMKSSDEMSKLFAGQFVGLADNTFSGIVLQATTSLETFVTDEGVMHLVTTKNRIHPEMLMDVKSPKHIYLAIPEYKLEQCRGFISIFFDMNLKYFSMIDERRSVPVLFLQIGRAHV